MDNLSYVATAWLVAIGVPAVYALYLRVRGRRTLQRLEQAVDTRAMRDTSNTSNVRDMGEAGDASGGGDASDADTHLSN